MTYFSRSIFKTRATLVKGKYYRFSLHLPLRKHMCAIGPLYRCAFNDVPALILGPKDVVDALVECFRQDGFEGSCTEVYPVTYRRRKGSYTIAECRVPLTLYIRQSFAKLYGTSFLVYYDKVTPLVTAFPADPAVPVPLCVRHLISKALEKPDTIVRSFRPEELASILFD